MKLISKKQKSKRIFNPHLLYFKINMPKGNKKTPKKFSCDSTSDFKLSDFANCSTRGGRLRKSVGGSLEKAAEILDTDDILWYEKDLEDFDLKISLDGKKKSQKPKTNKESPISLGSQYPIDIWFLIGQFIKPEDVKLFASICKDSYYVSRSYSFWVNMYKRYYKPSAALPTRLQPDCIEQSFCLKPCVVRALYHMYPQFTSCNFSSDIYCLSNLCCTLMWRIQQNGKWHFHFKFQTATGNANASLTYNVAIKDFWTDHEKSQDIYVNHNPNDGCKVLRFQCSHFVAVPPLVMGSRLSDVRINLAHDMRRQKLQLTFCYSNYRQSKSVGISKESGGYSDIVEFDAIENLMVLNWWHPQYPYDLKI